MRIIKEVVSGNIKHEVVTHDEVVFFFNTIITMPNGRTTEDGEIFYTERKAINRFNNYLNSVNTLK